MAKFNIKNPSGFPEFSPAEERLRLDWITTIGQTFEKYGFVSITTPMVEREENLLGKGGNAKEMYALKRVLDEAGDTSHSGNALRFDHTVPLALYVARHQNEITFPFKRSVIGPVFRGERAQKGRFRQFDQCDIDIIGSEKLSLHNDALVVAVVAEIFEKLKIGDFVVRINNRKILAGFFQFLGLKDDQFKPVLDIIDDLEKVPQEKLEVQLATLGLSPEKIDQLFVFVSLENPSIETLKSKATGDLFTEGLEELAQVLEALKALGVPEKQYKVDLKIARGLDYYTGTVYETTLTDHPEFGSVCSGGRYEDLASVFTGKKMPGVGISIGLTRLFAQALDAGIVSSVSANATQVLLVSADSIADLPLLTLGQELRAAGINAENYLEDRKLGKKFDYADKMGITYVAVCGENELSNKYVQLKDMSTGHQEEISFAQLKERFEA